MTHSAQAAASILINPLVGFDPTEVILNAHQSVQTLSPRAEGFFCVRSMTDSLEVEVLYPA